MDILVQRFIPLSLRTPFSNRSRFPGYRNANHAMNKAKKQDQKTQPEMGRLRSGIDLSLGGFR